METTRPTLKVGCVLVWTTYARGGRVTFSHWLVLDTNSTKIRVVCIADDNMEVWNPSGTCSIEMDITSFGDDLVTNKREPGAWSFL